MTKPTLDIDLVFQSFTEDLACRSGLYVRTLNHFGKTIDYVGTAGETEDSSFGTRLKEHTRKYRKSESTYLKFDYDDHTNATTSDYLKMWSEIVSAGYPRDRIFVPGMPLSYHKDNAQSMRISSEIWTVFVAPLDSFMPALIETFGTRRSGLRSVEAKLQSTLRAFYILKIKTSNFPIDVRIKGQAGESSTRSQLLGDTRAIDLSHSRQIRIREFSLPFENEFANELRSYIEDEQSTEPAPAKSPRGR